MNHHHLQNDTMVASHSHDETTMMPSNNNDHNITNGAASSSHQHLDQIIPPLLDTTQTLQATLHTTNVTMPPKHFFSHLNLSLTYLNHVKARLRKHRDLMRRQRCIPLQWGTSALAARGRGDSSQQNHKEQLVIQENTQQRLVEMLSVFRVKNIGDNAAAGSVSGGNHGAAAAVQKNSPLAALSADEMALLGDSAAGKNSTTSGNQQDATSNSSSNTTTPQEAFVLNSRKYMEYIQQEVDEQRDEFEIPQPEIDDFIENEYLQEYREEADDLMRTVIEDETKLPAIEAFFDQREHLLQQQQEPVFLRNINSSEPLIDDPLTKEQRKQLSAQLGQQRRAQRALTKEKKQVEYLKRHTYASKFFDSSLSRTNSTT